MDFKILIDMVQTITRNKIKHIQVLGNNDQKGSLVESFYEGILTGKVTTDETAVRYLYGHDNKKDVAYQRLKNRLIKQLTTTALFVDVNQPSYNDRAKAYFTCYRDFAAAFVLMARSSPKAGIYLLEQVLEQSIKYEFIELAAEITRHLRTQTARIISGQKQHQNYVTLHRLYEEKRRLEILALDYYEELVDYYITRRSPNQEVKRLAERYYDELMALSPKADTSRFYYYTYQIGIIKYFSINNCTEAVNLANEALALLESRKNTNRTMLQAIALQKLACLTQLRIFDNNDGEKVAEYCFSLLIDGDIDWIGTAQIYFYYLTYKRKYTEALCIFDKAIEHPCFLQIAEISKDNWLLIGGYLHLLAALGQLNPKEVESTAGPFRYGRLLNQVKVVNKDREGMNIPLMLLPILFSLAQGNYQNYGRSKEALDKYRQRYLENGVNKRSAVFVTMLLALDKKTFQPADAERRIKKSLEELNQENPQVIGQSFAIEIIPYEDLWAMLQTVRR